MAGHVGGNGVTFDNRAFAADSPLPASPV